MLPVSFSLFLYPVNYLIDLGAAFLPEHLTAVLSTWGCLTFQGMAILGVYVSFCLVSVCLRHSGHSLGRPAFRVSLGKVPGGFFACEKPRPLVLQKGKLRLTVVEPFAQQAQSGAV